MMKGFNNDTYINLQSTKIKEKMKLFEGTLYLEFGGKLYDDFHASRVLPGFDPNVKIHLLEELKEQAEVIFCINASDIEKNKIRADYGITYDMEVLRLIEHLNELQIAVNSVVITLYKEQPSALKFKKKLEERHIKVYLHTATKGYPTDLDVIVSNEGYGANPYIETTKPLVVVTAPGAGSGKLATCLSQLYHEYKQGKQAGYAKFETFPVWNLPLSHPLNIAYEAATADIGDRNMIDSFHLEKYGIQSINYNRDLETFPILKTILKKIVKKDIYASPTDMGVNMVASCIEDNETIVSASKQEIIRRFYKASVDYKKGIVSEDVPKRIKLLMNELDLHTRDRPTIEKAIHKSKQENRHVMAITLPNGKIITGKQTDLLSPTASAVINAIKELTKIPDEVYLLSPSILEPILDLNINTLHNRSYILSLEDVLIALSICSVTNPIIEKALKNLDCLRGCEAHTTYILENGDLKMLQKLQIQFTSEPEFFSDHLFEDRNE